MCSQLICDKQVARLVSLSPSWVRSQRWKRANKINHSFHVDAVYIGSCPRYRKEEVEKWIYAIGGK